jgi:O-succinylbenzoate synthase
VSPRGRFVKHAASVERGAGDDFGSDARVGKWRVVALRLHSSGQLAVLRAVLERELRSVIRAKSIVSSVVLEIVPFVHEAVETSQLCTSGRSSILLRLPTAGGFAWGEACPLSGYGRDSFEGSHEQLVRQKSEDLLDAVDAIVLSERGRELQDAGGVVMDAVESVSLSGSASPLGILESLSAGCSSPSARFCVETAVLDASAQALGVPPGLLLVNSPEVVRLDTSRVLDPLQPDSLKQARILLDHGIGTFKLKCGRSEDAEVEFLRRLAEYSLSATIPIAVRLDPNGASGSAGIERLLGAAAGLEVEWVEDPTSELADWSALVSSLPGLTLAIDEPLVGVEPKAAFLERSGARVCVLKPQALGGFAKAFHWAAVANSLGMTVNISHFFDGPVAFDATVQLAFCLQTPGVVPGLGRHVALNAFGGKWPEPRFLEGESLSFFGSSSAP